MWPAILQREGRLPGQLLTRLHACIETAKAARKNSSFSLPELAERSHLWPNDSKACFVMTALAAAARSSSRGGPSWDRATLATSTPGTGVALCSRDERSALTSDARRVDVTATARQAASASGRIAACSAGHTASFRERSSTRISCTAAFSAALVEASSQRREISSLSAIANGGTGPNP